MPPIISPPNAIIAIYEPSSSEISNGYASDIKIFNAGEVHPTCIPVMKIAKLAEKKKLS